MRLIQLHETDSTNTWLKNNRKSLENGDAVTALHQSEGRGRFGHIWLDSDGMLPVSVLLRGIDDPATVTLCAAVAVCRTLEPYAGDRLLIKWPNDIILRGYKLCGILCESVCDGDGMHIICGVGVNLSQSADYFKKVGLPYGGSLVSLGGKSPDRQTIAYAIAQNISRLCADGFAAVFDEYRQRCITLGRQVRLISGGSERTAFAEDIASNGYLICRDESGVCEVNSGEVSVRGIYGYV